MMTADSKVNKPVNMRGLEMCPPTDSEPSKQQRSGTLSLKARVLQALARREHTRAELHRKLGIHAQSPEELDSILEALAKAGLFSENRAIAAVIQQKSQRWGSARIRHALREKGADAAQIQALMDTAQLSASEPERAYAVWQRKFKAPPQNPTEQAKQMRFLAARGFSSEAIRYAIRCALGRQRDSNSDAGDTMAP